MYRHVDAALVRATAYPGGLVLPPRPDLSSNEVGDLRDWIARVWAITEVAEAVEVASPVLARHVRAVCTGGVQPKRVRRTAFALVRYVLRFTHRATPFGLFAGVGPVRFGSGLMLGWADEHRPVARVDAVWLSRVLRRLEACPELLARLPVMADSTCFVRGERLVVPCQRPPGDRVSGRASDRASAPGEMSVRYTRAVAIAVDAAAVPVVISELAATLTAAYPDYPAEMIGVLLAELVCRGVLLTALWPPMTVTDPLGHVVAQLAAVAADDIPAVAATVCALREIQAMLSRHTDAPAQTRRGLRESARARMTALSDVVESPLTVDLRLDCSLSLPREVAREAEKAATALTRLTPCPSGSASWRDYHARFLERYGIGALVALRELADPDTGLGLPAGYRGSLLTRPVQGLTGRDERLLALAQRAAYEHASEIILTDSLLAALGPADATVHPVHPAHLDLCFRVEAASRDLLDSGDFTLVVTGLTPAAGATAGRFLDLLDTPDRARMTAAYLGLPTLDAGALRAQISCPALDVRTDNVSRAPQIWPHVISLAEHRPRRALSIEDLAVGADANRMWLVSISTGHRVEPAAMNAVDMPHFTHPLARLACELPRAGTAALGMFSWGAAHTLPLLPRVRYGRCVLAPATWRIEATELAGPSASATRWKQSVAAWRQRFGLPSAVQLGEDDRRLRLDLDEDPDLALLRAELARHGHLTLREVPEPAAYRWFDGRPHEITLALASTRSPAAAPAPRPTAAAVVIDRDHGHLPGDSPWAFVKLYGHPDRVPEILTRHLPALLADWPDPPQWWFVRYRDPHDHLRLRMRLGSPHPEAFTRAATRIGPWVAGLRRRGLLGHARFDTYYPETGRYGRGEVLAAAETVFAADSAAAIAQITLAARGDPHPRAVISASLIDLVISFTGRLNGGMRWLIDHASTDAAPHIPRPVHREAMRLADPRDGFAALRQLPGGDAVTATWAARRDALRAYHAQLETGREPRPLAVLPSLLHMHHLRMTGPDTEEENACYRLARSAALSFLARGEGAAQ